MYVVAVSCAETQKSVTAKMHVMTVSCPSHNAHVKSNIYTVLSLAATVIDAVYIVNY